MRRIDRLIVITFVVLLTWVLFKGFNPATEHAQSGLRALDAFDLSSDALHRDVLSARAGLLNNYDPLNDDVLQMERSIAELDVAPIGEAQVKHRKGIVASFRRQSQLLEQFKSDNALLQNSLAYFALFSGRSQIGRQRSVRHAVARLSGAMLTLNINGTMTAQSDVGNRINALERLCGSGRAFCSRDARAILAHAKLLRTLIPQNARTIELLVKQDGARAGTPLRRDLMLEQGKAEIAAGHFRLLLYFASLMLLYLLVRWVLMVRGHRATLQRQLTLEHAVARLSTRLIATDAQHVREHVERALGDLCEALGAARACLGLEEDADGFAWPDRAHMMPLKWANSLQESARPATGTSLAIVYLSRNLLPNGPEQAWLECASLEACYCLMPPDDEKSTLLLAFGFAKATRQWTPPQLTVLGAALDAILLSLQHVRSEEERERLAAQLGHARRMETVGAFASGIAHNFNNLLGAISGHIEIAQDLAQSKRLKDHLEQVQLSADRGRDLVEGLLSYGRRRVSRKKIIPLDRLVEESCSLAHSALGSGYRLQFIADAGDIEILADPGQVQHLIINLCNNAAQASPPGSTVDISTEVRAKGSAAALEGGLDSDFAIIRVADHGRGIPEEFRKKVFEPFFTTRPTGTGLGLSTAREIAEEHGGYLKLQSQVGRGTHVELWLPLTTQHREQIVPVADDSFRGTGETVLFLAPDRRGRLLGEEILAALGFECFGFERVDAGLAALDSGPDRFDVLLLAETRMNDIVSSLVASARQRSPPLPVLIAVSDAGDYDALALSRMGVSAVMKYPLETQELFATLCRTLQKERLRLTA